MAYDPFVTFGAEEAAEREGPYIMTLGLPGSGKSTFHAFLLRYIEESVALKADVEIPDLPGGQPDLQTLDMLNTWRRQRQEGEFVDRTVANDAGIREMIYRVRPTKGVRTPMNFGVVEVSGEQLKQVEGGLLSAQRLPDAFDGLLGNDYVSLTLVFVIHPDDPGNDVLLANFVSYVDANFPGLRETMPLAVIIADPDRALERLRAHQSGARVRGREHHNFDAQAIDAFMQVHAPGIRGMVGAWPGGRTMICPLYLGEIRTRTGLGGREISYLHSPDKVHISRIFNWLYFQITGRKRGKTLLQRLWHYLSSHD